MRVSECAWIAIGTLSLGCSHDTPTPPHDGTGGRILPASLLAWRDSNITVNSRPVFDGTAVYVLAAHTVTAVNKTTGEKLWSTPLTQSPNAPNSFGYAVALASGHVIAGDVDVFGLDATTGTTLWRFSPESTFPGERAGFDHLTSDGSTVYCGGVWGNVYAVDAATGLARWTTHVTTAPDSTIRVFSPTIDQAVVYVGFGDDKLTSASVTGGVAAIDVATGKLLWSTFLPKRATNASNSDTRKVVVTPTRVVAGTYDGYIYGLDRTSGAIVDTVPATELGLAAGTLTGSFSLAVQGGVLVVGIATGQLVALDAGNLHQLRWTSTFNRGSVVDVVTDASRVYASYLGGQFSAIDIATGSAIWWIERTDFRAMAEEIPWSAGIDGDRLYVGASADLFAFNRK